MSNWPITGSLWLSCLTFSVISCEWCSECSLSRNILCCSELARRQVSHVDNVQEEIPGQERTRATSWGNNMWLLIEMKKEWDVPLWRQRGSACPDWSSWSWEDESTDFSDLVTNSTNGWSFHSPTEMSWPLLVRLFHEEPVPPKYILFCRLYLKTNAPTILCANWQMLAYIWHTY